MLLLVFAPALGVLPIMLIAPRGSVIIDRGAIEFSKRFRRRRLTTEDALCMVSVMWRQIFVEWHEPYNRWPSLHLYFKDPNAPRLATIVNLWIADPIPDS